MVRCMCLRMCSTMQRVVDHKLRRGKLLCRGLGHFGGSRYAMRETTGGVGGFGWTDSLTCVGKRGRSGLGGLKHLGI